MTLSEGDPIAFVFAEVFTFTGDVVICARGGRRAAHRMLREVVQEWSPGRQRILVPVVAMRFVGVERSQARNASSNSDAPDWVMAICGDLEAGGGA
jgi:hypothetical protein